MASNALAPKTQNSFVRNPIQDLLTQSAAYPQYQDLVNFLSARRTVPEMNQSYYMGGANGEFTSGWGIPNRGVINLKYGAHPSTLIHEFTHAADRQIGQLYEELSRQRNSFTKNRELNPVELQFLDAYEKMIVGKKDGKIVSQRQELLNKLAPEWTKKEQDYRASSHEAPAFGMASQIRSNQDRYSAPLHVDPTMGTEFSILLDLAQRAQNIQPVVDKR